MPDLIESAFGAPAADPGNSNRCMDPGEIIRPQTSMRRGRLYGVHDGSPSPLNADPG